MGGGGCCVEWLVGVWGWARLDLVGWCRSGAPVTCPVGVVERARTGQQLVRVRPEVVPLGLQQVGRQFGTPVAVVECQRWNTHPYTHKPYMYSVTELCNNDTEAKRCFATHDEDNDYFNIWFIWRNPLFTNGETQTGFCKLQGYSSKFHHVQYCD